MESTKWVKITRQTFIKGELAEVDGVFRVDGKDYRQLTTGSKKAIPWHAKGSKTVKPEPDKMTPPANENREKDLLGKIAKRGRAKKVKGKKL